MELELMILGLICGAVTGILIMIAVWGYYYVRSI